MKYYAETWDKMQDIMSRYNDHMTHGYLQFDRHLDIDVLKSALSISVDNVQILRDVYRSGIFNAHWKPFKHYNFENCYSFREFDDDLMGNCEKFLLRIINEKKEAQVKFLHARCKDKDALCILINHQCMDGADLKVYYNKIADLYNDLLNGGHGDVSFKKGSRSEIQLYEELSSDELEEIDKLISYSKKQKSKLSFPFIKAPRSKMTPQVHKLRLPADRFFKMKNNGKILGVSINDILLGAFYRSAIAIIKPPEGKALGIPNMINMRRYIKSGESAGFCNLTSMIVLNIGDNIGDNIFDTVIKCKEGMDKLKNHFPGFHGWALLRRVFKYAPHGLAKFLIGTFFKNPLVGISNIGIIDDDHLVFGDAKLESPTYMTGSVKYPPYMQLALTTLRNEITFTVANHGTPKDHDMLERFLDILNNVLNEFIDADLSSYKVI
ncbi:MAG: hypothetical protein LBF68_04915 [Christensenellaceae bacterium]|jgi:NRPS condensation-like uncharacterized protein|nr:hypothetical protein [Christensenellaceae bacterium]